MQRIHLPVIGGRTPSTTVPADGRSPVGDPLVDGFARRIRYLRISVTDRCNYRCSYCMPEDAELAHPLAFAPRSAVLTFEEIERLVRVFAEHGVRKLRLTGGEPTIRRGIVDLVGRLARVRGIEQVVMTTNGHLLEDLARPLADAGLRGINVSLDTLDPDRFATLTGRGDLSRVLRGIEAARAAGLAIKTNAVALDDYRGDIVSLCRYAWSMGATPRFIEHMPLSSGVLHDHAGQVSAADIRQVIEAEWGALVPSQPTARDAGPARYWHIAGDVDSVREVGIISAMTEHFCDDCNRLRLTATGDLHACLGHDDAVSLRDVIRSPASIADDDAVVAAIAMSVTGKRAGHTFGDVDGAPTKHMIGIGG